jgi:isopenicillin-N N-acyltransferase-like protein
MAAAPRFTSSTLGPYERGLEFGERNRREVARTVAAYHHLFRAQALGAFDVDRWSAAAWDRIEATLPVPASEIRGIAEGARLPVRDVAGINARTELLAIANPTGVTECSTVVSLPPGRPPVAVQTWDWYHAMAGNWLHWTIPHPDGRVVETVTEYGILGKIGVSSAGVGVLFNMLHHADDGQERVGHPLHLLSRHVLDTAADAQEALVAAKAADCSASSSLTVVDRAGSALSVELFPGGAGVVEPEGSLLVRTNHFLSAEPRPGCLADGIGPGSATRRATLLDAFRGRPPASARQVVASMRDHREVGGVCAHPDPALDPMLQHATLATVSLDVAGGTLAVTPGGPCA